MRYLLRASAGLAVPMVLAACGDSVTAPAAVPGLTTARLSDHGFRGVRTAGKDPEFVCYTSEPASLPGSGRYLYRRYKLNFPKEARARDGATSIFRVVYQDPGKNPVAVANCRIPNTPAALSLVKERFVAEERRRLAVQTSGKSPRFDYDPCPPSGCQLAGLTVVAYPASYYSGWGGGGGSTGGWADWGSSMGDSASYGGEWDPGTPPDAVPCNTNGAEPILDDANFEFSASALWQQTNYSPETPQSERLEQYAWIVQSADGYVFVPMGVPPAPCGPEGEIEVGPAPEGTVAWIHTHPWAVGDMQTTCGEVPTLYYGAPSDADVATSHTLNLPGYIMDATQITKFDGRGETVPAPVNSIVNTVERCGY